MIARPVYPLVLFGYHLGLASAVIIGGSLACKVLGLTEARARCAGLCACFTLVEVAAAIPMAVFVTRYGGIRDEDLNFLATHTIFVTVPLVVSSVLASGLRNCRAQMLAINLLSIPFLLVAWLSG